MTAAAVWAGLGYVGIGPGVAPAWLSANAWAIASLAVIPLLVLALPWQRRRRADDDAAAPAAFPVPAGAMAGSAGPAAGQLTGPATCSRQRTSMRARRVRTVLIQNGFVG